MWKIPVVAALALAATVVGADPAAAHGVAGVEPTNYDTRNISLEPPVEGLEVRAVDLGESIELRNTTTTEVHVLGYHGEPYLRVGPDGVFENRRSPSWVANQSPDGLVGDPDDAEATPEWVRVGSGDTVRWHDHRAHWMGREPPTSVTDDAGAEHLVLDFEIPLEHGDRRVIVVGEVVWVPGPSPWPWVAGALGLGLLVLGLSRTRSWAPAVGTALAVLLVAETVHVVGVWGGTTAGAWTKLAAIVYSVAALAIASGALVWLVIARDPYDATPLVLVAGLFVAISGGFADLTTLTRSQVPTALDPDLARAVVMVALGLGSGITLAAALRIRRPDPTGTRRRRSSSGGVGGGR